MRNTLLKQEIVRKCDELIRQKQPLYFLPCDVSEQNINGVYNILLQGVLEDGRKTLVVINDVRPYITIRYPKEHVRFESKIGYVPMAQDRFPDIVRSNLGTNIATQHMMGKKFKGYEHFQWSYLKVSFANTWDREMAMKKLPSNYELANNDKGKYYLHVIREYKKSFSTWNEIKNYTFNKELKYLKFTLALGNMNAITDINVSKNIVDYSIILTWDIECRTPDGSFPSPYDMSHTLFCISSTVGFASDANVMKKIGFICNPAGKGKVEVSERKDMEIIPCQDEKEVIRKFIEFVAGIQPDYIIGFNDSDFDYPWLVYRALQHNLAKQLFKSWDLFEREPKFVVKMDFNSWYQSITDKETHKAKYLSEIFKYSFPETQIKIDASTQVVSRAVKVFGCLAIDVRIMCRILDTKSNESNLNFYLKSAKLPLKKDMPIFEMFKICNVAADNKEEFPKEKFTEIAEYCIQDAMSCHALFLKRRVISSVRALGEMTFIPPYEAFYRAGGMKVRNVVISYALERGYHMDMEVRKIPKEKYPGAFVVNPKSAGMQASKLRLDEKEMELQINFSVQLGYKLIKLYYKLGKKISYIVIKMVLSAENAKVLIAHIEELNKFPSIALDFASLYPSIIMDRNLSPETSVVIQSDNEASIKQAKAIANYMETSDKVAKNFKCNYFEFMYGSMQVKKAAYFVWFDPKTKNQDGTPLGFGVFPTILDKLFKMRKQIKKPKAWFEVLAEHCEIANLEFMTYDDALAHLQHLKLIEDKDINTFNEVFPKTGMTADEIDFWFSYFNAKQYALKILMNTFYGETGNALSPLFVLELAGTITTYGQERLKFSYEIALKLGWQIHYGDTDSLYMSPPETCFTHLDEKYYTGEISKIEYWTEMVKVAYAEAKKIRNIINVETSKITGTERLNMEFEEVLFPYMFISKKKYFGTPHSNSIIEENKITFNPKKILIKGMDIVKRDTTPLMKAETDKLLRTSLSPENRKDLYELILETIDGFYSKKFSYEEFMIPGTYKKVSEQQLEEGKGNKTILKFVERMYHKGIIINPAEKFHFVFIKINPFEYNEFGNLIKKKTGDRMELVDVAKEQNMEIDVDYYVVQRFLTALARMCLYKPEFKPREGFTEKKEEKKEIDMCVAKAKALLQRYASQYFTHYVNRAKVAKVVSRAAQNIIDDGKKLNKKIIKAKWNSLTEFQNVREDYLKELVEEMVFDSFNNTIEAAKQRYGIRKYALELSSQYTAQQIADLRNIHAKNRIEVMKKYEEVYKELIKASELYKMNLANIINKINNKEFKEIDSKKFKPSEMPDLNAISEQIKTKITPEYIDIDKQEMQKCIDVLEKITGKIAAIDEEFKSSYWVYHLNKKIADFAVDAIKGFPKVSTIGVNAIADMII